MKVFYAKGALTIKMYSGILSIGKCWIDNSFGYIWFPSENGKVIIKKFWR